MRPIPSWAACHPDRPDDDGSVTPHSAVFFVDRLTGHGWSEAHVADDRGFASLTASYLSEGSDRSSEAVASLIAARLRRAVWTPGSPS